MGTYRTPFAARAAQAEGRPAAGSRPSLSDRHRFRAQVRYPLGIPAAGDGLRGRHDVLASPARLATRGGLAKDLVRTVGRVRPGRRYRLVYFGAGQLYAARRSWGEKTGPNPTDRGKNGSKRHLIVDGQGTPLAIDHTGANVHDSEMAITLVDAIPSIKQPRGRPRRRPDRLLADRAYDAEKKIRQPLRARHIKPLIAKRNTEHGSGIGKNRWVVEAAFAWLFQYRRLRVRYEKRDDIHEAFRIIGCLLICWNRVQKLCYEL